MKILIALVLVAAVALPAAAHDLGARVPDKPAGAATPPPPDPAVLRQGGDTIADAVPITLPVVDLTGTTAGYVDDTDECCPYCWSISPDVVYSLTPAVDLAVTIDLYGSEYDTKVYVYDENLELLDCNDDYYNDYTSLIQNLPLAGGTLYYVVIDGYGGDAGTYLLNIAGYEPCIIDCPAGAVLENEPPFGDGYVDLFNAGCDVDCDDPALQPITSPLFYGQSGFYQREGVTYRDTDWFLLHIPGSGVLEITGDAELMCYMFELWPQDCHLIDVAQLVEIGPCLPHTMVIEGEPGDPIWFWVGPTTFYPPDGSDLYKFEYLLELNLDPVTVEEHSWSAVKALFD